MLLKSSWVLAITFILTLAICLFFDLHQPPMPLEKTEVFVVTGACLLFSALVVFIATAILGTFKRGDK